VRRIPLEGAVTTGEAVKAMNKLKVQREENQLPVLRQTPYLEELTAKYFEFHEKAKDAKRASTIKKEKTAMRRWNEHFGPVRVNQINRAMIKSFQANRQAAGVSGRTVNLDVIALRNVLKFAVDDGWLTSLPTQNMRPLKWTPKKVRQLMTDEEISQLCAAASKVSKNAQQYADYFKLMAYCGSRRNETLRLKWSDVNWDKQQLAIGTDGLAKNRERRFVDFNPDLQSHLSDMYSRRAPESDWIFPSPQRGDKDIPAKSFTESHKLARDEAKLPHIGFHDCRHYFISHCVMSGVDYMTIAKWVGHRDGGILIGKVYGHLNDEHAKQQAERVVFAPRVVEHAEAAAG
jgi:integrase